MTAIIIPAAKLTVVFKPGSLPRISPDRPEFILDMGGHVIAVKINAKAARKLAVHTGGALLQGRLVSQGGGLALLEAGLQFLDPKPIETEKPQAEEATP
jgi:hypothetical protein